jgi:hypothetical protein
MDQLVRMEDGPGGGRGERPPAGEGGHRGGHGGRAGMGGGVGGGVGGMGAGGRGM